MIKYEKECPGCHETKPLCDFLQYYPNCITCRKAYYKNKRSADPLIAWSAKHNPPKVAYSFSKKEASSY